MRLWTGLVLVLAAAWLAAPAQGSTMKTKGPLRQATAERIATEIGAGAVHRSRHLRTHAAPECTRLGARSIDCVVDAHGEARRHRIKLDCSFTIAVRVRGDQPFGRMADRQCELLKPPYLSRPRAVKALWKVLLEAHPGEVPLQMIGIKRVSSGGFTGQGVWLEGIGPNSAEFCASEMAVYWNGPASLTVETGDPTCKQVSHIEG